MKNIVVFGLGYVGLSNALLFAQNNKVVGIEIDGQKVELLNKGMSTIEDKEISEFLKNKELNFIAKVEDDEAIASADYILICTPTNYDEASQYFDTSSVVSVVEKVRKLNKSAIIVIKSTIPIGFVDGLVSKYPNMRILFSPEFLREGSALRDNLYPSRIIVGTDLTNKKLCKFASEFRDLMLNSAVDKNIPTFIMSYQEAECVKLFSNTYLAMRVAFFNELDSFALSKNYNSKSIIEGVCADKRIGEYYNNPSFGYGGYCLPKDTKQLFSEYEMTFVPNELMRAIVDSNSCRKRIIMKDILNKTKSNEVIGVYRLTMKANSDNCRYSAIVDVVKLLSRYRKVVVYEPTINRLEIDNVTLVKTLQELKNNSQLILTNRIMPDIVDVIEKVYTRDIYSRD